MGAPGVYKRILAGFDGSEASLRAVQKAADLAAAMGSELILVTVVPPPTAMLGELMTPEVIDPKPLLDSARDALERLIAKLEREKGVKARYHVILGDPADTIVEVAEDEQADLIVLGRRGLSRIERLFVGSVTRKVLERATRDVLVVVA